MESEQKGAKITKQRLGKAAMADPGATGPAFRLKPRHSFSVPFVLFCSNSFPFLGSIGLRKNRALRAGFPGQETGARPFPSVPEWQTADRHPQFLLQGLLVF